MISTALLCAAGCGTSIAEAPRTFPRTPQRIYCSDACAREGDRQAVRRSYRKHRPKRIAQVRAWQAAHPDESRAITRRSQLANPEREAKASRRTRLKLRFGLSVAEYDAMARAQDGVCAICRQPEAQLTRNGDIQRLAVDHDHETDQVRGLLCQSCNQALGWLERFEREPRWRSAAEAYLRSEERLREVV